MEITLSASPVFTDVILDITHAGNVYGGADIGNPVDV